MDTVTHMFTECGLVKDAWLWTRRRMLNMLPQDLPQDLSNQEFIQLFYPKENLENEVTWVIGTYMGLVYDEAFVRGRILTVDYARAFFRNAWLESKRKNMPQIIFISDITTNLQQNIVFDNG